MSEVPLQQRVPLISRVRSEFLLKTRVRTPRGGHQRWGLLSFCHVGVVSMSISTSTEFPARLAMSDFSSFILARTCACSCVKDLA